jgi:hypothetical protein
MANLSPFQRGYGSLQLFSVNQQVPNGAESDFMLTGLRRDEQTARAPGVFQETPFEAYNAGSDEAEDSWSAGKRLPGEQ